MSSEYTVLFSCWDCGVKVKVKGPARIQKWREEHLKEHERTRIPCRLQVVTVHA